MRIKRPIILFATIILVLVIILYVSNKKSNLNVFKNLDSIRMTAADSDHLPIPPEIVIAVVACATRLQETLNMIKSAIIFNTRNTPLKFVIVTETNLMNDFREILLKWQKISNYHFVYEIMPLSFPTQNEHDWKALFKPCAAQRLFLPSLLKEIDSLIYMDTDTIFLSPLLETWQFFYKFNSSQIAGLSPEHEDRNVGWYNRFARHPFYGPLGVNSGVMLMNLTRMRSFKWEDYMFPLHKEYKLKITWGDQDLINILFFYHPDKLFVFPCEFNYRPDHCMYMSVCKAPDGVQILHGNRGYFHSDKQPAYTAVYRIIDEYKLGTDIYQNIVLPLESAFREQIVQLSNCGKVADKFVAKFKMNFNKTIDEYYNENRV